MDINIDDLKHRGDGMNTRKRILLITFVMILALTCFLALIVEQSISRLMQKNIETRYTNDSFLLSEAFRSKYEAEAFSSDADIQHFSEQVHSETGDRVTIIRTDGKVVADTAESPKNLNNHLNRQEVAEALKTGHGSSVRYSNSVHADFIYSARLVSIGGINWIVRLSREIEDVKQVSDKIKLITLAVIALIAISAIISNVYLSRKFYEPVIALTEAAELVAKGDFDKRIYTGSGDELGKLAGAFNQMSERLSFSITELKSKNVELQTIVSAVGLGIAVISRNNTIAYYNQLMQQYLDLATDEDALKWSNSRIFFRNEEIYQAINKVLQGAGSQIINIKTQYDLQVEVIPIDDEKNSALVVMYDMTRLNRLEMIRSDFVSNVSHELKTPLTSIKGFVDTLLDGAMKEEETAKRFLQIIDIESDRLIRLIDDILYLSEIETTKVAKSNVLCSLQEVLEETVDMLRNKAEEKQLTLTLKHDIPNAIFNGSKDRMKQLFINLIDNAIKYTDQGGVTVTAYIADNVKIYVRDTGIGFDDSDADRIFERFYRMDSDRSRHRGGTGLGLAIAKHITMLYGGRITVKSQIGKGTEFLIEFPLALIHEATKI